MREQILNEAQIKYLTMQSKSFMDFQNTVGSGNMKDSDFEIQVRTAEAITDKICKASTNMAESAAARNFVLSEVAKAETQWRKDNGLPIYEPHPGAYASKDPRPGMWFE